MTLRSYIMFSIWFSSFFQKRINKKKWYEKNLLLEKANFQIEYDEYSAVIFTTSMLSLLVGVLIFITVYIFLPFNLSFFYLSIPVVIGVIIGVVLFFLPHFYVGKRKRNIDRYLPFAVNYINTMAKTNIAPIEIFHSLSTLSTYGAIKDESLKIVKEIKMMGVDNISALKHAIDRSPSSKFKGFLQGLIGTIQAGSNLTNYLSNMADFYMKEDLRNREKNLESLSLIAELFVIAVIAFPIFLIIIVTVFGFIGETTPSFYDLIFYVSFILLPIAYVGFYYVIKSTLNEDFKDEKKKQDNNSFISFYQMHSSVIKIIGFSAVFLSVVLAGITLAFYYEYIIYNQYYLFDIIFISLLILIGPYGLYCYLKSKKEKEIQHRFPDFLVDMGNSLSSGMSVYDSLHVASKGNYGKFTEEVKKMKVDLSWHIPIKHIFLNLSKRLKNSIVDRAIITINKGLYMGGGNADIFKALSHEVKQINQIDEQRNVQMTMYMMIIIISFMVFLFIMIILNNTLFSYFFEFQQSQQNALESFLIPVQKTRLHYALYSFTFVQSIGAGLLGGYMKEGAISPGLRYSLVLGLISIILFQIFL